MDKFHPKTCRVEHVDFVGLFFFVNFGTTAVLSTDEMQTSKCVGEQLRNLDGRASDCGLQPERGAMNIDEHTQLHQDSSQLLREASHRQNYFFITVSDHLEKQYESRRAGVFATLPMRLALQVLLDLSLAVLGSEGCGCVKRTDFSQSKFVVFSSSGDLQVEGSSGEIFLAKTSTDCLEHKDKPEQTPEHVCEVSWGASAPPVHRTFQGGGSTHRRNSHDSAAARSSMRRNDFKTFLSFPTATSPCRGSDPPYQMGTSLAVR